MKRVKLKEICRIVSGATPKRNRDKYWEGDIPWVTPKEISLLEGAFLFDSVEKITEVGYKSCSTEILPVNSLLMSSRAPIGLFAINKIPVCTNQGFKSLIPSHEIDVLFLYYYLKFHVEDIKSKGRGATFKEISKSIVENYPVYLPPKPDQTRIATLLSKVESLIAKRKKSIADLDELLKSTFLEMFGSFSDNKNGYSFEKLDIFITHITSGGRGWAKYYSESGKRFIRSLDVQMNKIGDDDVAYVNPPKNKEAKRTKIKSGDVLLTITGSKIGRVCFVPKGFEEAYISQHVAIIRTKGINSVYLSYYLSMPNSGQLIIQRKQYGQAKPGLNLDQIKNFEILNAPPAAQDKFATIVEKVERLKEKYQNSLNDLETLYGALSQKAFKGELDLSRIPITVELKPKDIISGVPQVGKSFLTVQDKSDKAPETREQILQRLFKR